MSGFAAVEVVLLLFVLRFIVPLLLVLFFGWVVNRVQSRWQAPG